VSAFDPVAFLETAVQHSSHEDVTGMRDFLVETLAANGVEAHVDDAGNTLAVRGDPGADGTHVALNTHIDTVSPHVPFERDGDVIRGRGACDAKGPLAAILDAFLAADPGDGRLTLAITPDEETLSTGAAALDVEADCYVVGEPTGLDVCNAAKGRFEGTLTLTGANAHAAEPDSGVNAVAAAEDALGSLRTFDADRDPHPSLGAATCTPTVIDGGGATNQIPDRCSIVVDRRSVPPESAEEFRAGLEAHVRAAVDDEVGVAFDLVDREAPFLEAFATDPDERLVTTLVDAVSATGHDPAVRPFTAATEASYFAPAPTVVFGPGSLADGDGAVAHSPREYVEVGQVEAAAASLRRALAVLL
jgi:acetylornithine deacetylase